MKANMAKLGYFSLDRLRYHETLPETSITYNVTLTMGAISYSLVSLLRLYYNEFD